MTMDANSVKMQRLLQSLKSVNNAYLSLWVLALTIPIGQITRLSQESLTLIWDLLQVVRSLSPKVVIMMSLQVSMMTVGSSVKMPSLSLFQRSVSKESPRQWALVLMTQTELTVRPSLRRPISI